MTSHCDQLIDQFGLSGNGSFAREGDKQLPLQLVWDSTSLGALKQCPRYYFLSIVLGFQPKKLAVDLAFGIWLHSVRERYYHHRADGLSHDDAQREALLWLFEATFDVERGRPWQSEDANKNRLTLVRTACWYMDQWEHDPLETIHLASGKPAVELSFKFETDYSSASGAPFSLAGHIDRLVLFGTERYVSDLKSTKSTLDASYAAQFSPDNQLSLYTLAAKVVYGESVKGILLDAAQVAVTFSRFQRFPVMRTEDQLAEWYDGLGDYLRQAEHYAAERSWPQNEKACFRCSFRSICAKPPSVRAEWLKSDFSRRVWDPSVSRGDI